MNLQHADLNPRLYSVDNSALVEFALSECSCYLFICYAVYVCVCVCVWYCYAWQCWGFVDLCCLSVTRTDIRPYKCRFCNYYARTNSQLKVHMMRHQGNWIPTSLWCSFFLSLPASLSEQTDAGMYYDSQHVKWYFHHRAYLNMIRNEMDGHLFAICNVLSDLSLIICPTCCRTSFCICHKIVKIWLIEEPSNDKYCCTSVTSYKEYQQLFLFRSIAMQGGRTQTIKKISRRETSRLESLHCWGCVDFGPSALLPLLVGLDAVRVRPY